MRQPLIDPLMENRREYGYLMTRFLPITREDAAMYGGMVDIFPYTIDGVEPAAKSSSEIEELRKFFKLSQERKKKGETTLMPACRVDTVWHEMMKDSAVYDAFCHQIVGTTVRHLPIKGEGELAWVNDYHAMFNQLLSPLWFTDVNGILNEKAYDAYVETGIARLSWDCGPY